MTPSIRELMLVVGNSLAGSIIAKVTIITALGLLAAWLARDNCAAVRHALLAAMFGVMFLLPAASLLMPPLHIGVPTVIPNSTTFLPFGLRADAEVSAATGSVATRAAGVTPSVSKISLSNLLLLGWAVGVVAFILPVIVGLWQIRLLRRSGLPWRGGRSVVDSLALSAGIRRRIEVLLHEKTPGPMMCGVANPAIVLPLDAETWNSEDLNRAIVHELEHVRRGDSASRCFARAICAVYWFHPLIWIAWRKLVLEAERACDDAVLARSEATAYADQLVDLAKRMSAAQGSPLLAMANRADLATRVRAVLNGRQRRGRAGKFSLVLACAAAVMLVLWLSPVTLIASPQQTQQTFEVASVKQNVSTSTSMKFPVPANGRFAVENIPLKVLILFAYGSGGDLSGAPGWVSSERYDVTAKAAKPDVARDDYALMLQALLVDRFRLSAHFEERELSGYTLMADKAGSKLVAASAPCAEPGAPRDPRNPDVVTCGTFFTGPASLDARKMSAPQFASTLSMVLAAPVIDKTGATGVYDIHLEFNPEGTNLNGRGVRALDTTADANNPDSDKPSIFTALQKQLGLRLEAAKVPTKVLVIDHVEKPTEN
ncbi:MAG TPA: M56 family metallopeptidase [Bryobacteraceae bacterium]|jgi:uncharacterized protein (TIGR03435 family)